MFGIVIPNKGYVMNKRMELNSHRRIFVVDIENAIGNGVITEEDVVREKAHLEEFYSISDKDLVVVGVSHGNNVFPAHAWTSARIVLKYGHDGADVALKKVLKHERIEDRFKEVVIVSGDGTFSEEAECMKSLGLKVTIHAEVKRIAARLLYFATCVNLTHKNKVAVQLKIAA